MGINIDTRQSIDIETSGGEVTLKLHGRTLLSIHIRGDGAADYALDVRDSQEGAWMQDVSSFTGTADYDTIEELGVSEVRLRCTTGTATAGQSADVFLSAGR